MVNQVAQYTYVYPNKSGKLSYFDSSDANKPSVLKHNLDFETVNSYMNKCGKAPLGQSNLMKITGHTEAFSKLNYDQTHDLYGKPLEAIIYNKDGITLKRVNDNWGSCSLVALSSMINISDPNKINIKEGINAYDDGYISKKRNITNSS